MTLYEGTDPYVFISYAHADSARVVPLLEELRRRGLRVWYDAGIEAGTEWPEYIAEHLLGCGCVVAFITQAALDSKNCRQEINFAIDEDKPLLAAYLEECTPTAGMRMRLNSLQAIYRPRHASDTAFLDALCQAAMVQPCLDRRAVDSLSAEELFRQGEAAYNAQNYGEAVRYYRVAAAEGYPAAQCRLGQCLEEGTGAEKNPLQAVAWYQKAADRGDPVAQYRLCSCFRDGIGVEANAYQSVYWCLKAAGQGFAQAQYALGGFYQCGWGVETDLALAADWYEKAAAQDYVDAQFALGSLYEKTEEGEQAVYWYEQAARLGSAEAQYRLGRLYELGLAGVEECRGKALYWYTKAADNGSFQARQELMILL